MVQIFKAETFQNLTTIVYCHFFFFLLIIDLYETKAIIIWNEENIVFLHVMKKTGWSGS